MQTLELEAVRDPATLAEWQVITERCAEVDYIQMPADPIDEMLPLLDPSLPLAGERHELRVWRVDGVAVAAGDIRVPLLDNLSAVNLDLRVHPEHRGRGYGRAALTALLDEAAALGRPRAFLNLVAPHPEGAGPGDRLARSLGFRPVLEEVRRLLDLANLPAAAEPAPCPAGYELIQWVDIAPEELLEGLAYLSMRMSTDPPMGEMDYEKEAWDAARYRESEAQARLRNRVRYATAVRHTESGRLVGMTDLLVNRHRRDLAWQWATIVDPDFRGHRLGMVLKTHNLALLRRESPQTRWVNTWNAESNTHMIAVNEAMGFRAVERWVEWQLDR